MGTFLCDIRCGGGGGSQGPLCKVTSLAPKCLTLHLVDYECTDKKKIVSHRYWTFLYYRKHYIYQYILRSIISPASCAFKKGCAKSTTRCLAAVMLRGAAAKSAFWWEKSATGLHNYTSLKMEIWIEIGKFVVFLLWKPIYAIHVLKGKRYIHKNIYTLANWVTINYIWTTIWITIYVKYAKFSTGTDFFHKFSFLINKPKAKNDCRRD